MDNAWKEGTQRTVVVVVWMMAFGGKVVEVVVSFVFIRVSLRSLVLVMGIVIVVEVNYLLFTR